MNFELAEWSSKIEVGVPAIDAQHRQLFDLAATFGGDGDQIRVLKTLAILTEYVKVHLHEAYHLSGFGPLEELGQRQCADSAPQQETEAAFEPG